MAKVSTTASYTIPGVYEPIEYIVETHTICDECGSADISYRADAHLPDAVGNGFLIIFFASLFGFIVLAMVACIFRFYICNVYICGLGVVPVIDIIVFSVLTLFIERNNDKDPKCNNCGNEHIT